MKGARIPKDHLDVSRKLVAPATNSTSNAVIAKTLTSARNVEYATVACNASIFREVTAASVNMDIESIHAISFTAKTSMSVTNILVFVITSASTHTGASGAVANAATS